MSSNISCPSLRQAASAAQGDAVHRGLRAPKPSSVQRLSSPGAQGNKGCVWRQEGGGELGMVCVAGRGHTVSV